MASDHEAQTKALEEELAQFRREREQIRMFLAQIGGGGGGKRDAAVNGVFILLMLGLFLVDVFRHFFHVELPFPQMFSLELGVMLVSLKIVWMMSKQMKVEHFQFWILNSIEFRLNDISKRFADIEERLPGKEPDAGARQ